ncbi:MAG: class I SAM-dependent methyltransferase [Candidatus Pacebacteria bacterium]|nr:class I SAM-dependent methyltransferase [Candidatus Paceibacterota bacterium]
MQTNLNQIEEDFIEFISLKRGFSYEEIKNYFLSTKKDFDFSSQEYRQICIDNYNLCKIIYDDTDEKDIIDSYKHHALMHAFRFISYSYLNSDSKKVCYLKKLKGYILKGEFFKILKRKVLRLLFWNKKMSQGIDSVGYGATAKKIIKILGDATPVVVDYGCGFGYLSFEIGMLRKDSKIYLVDIDSLNLEFAAFRFKKHNIDVETILITKDNIYPKLPQHNICIATEVMEHIMNPLVAYKNIYKGMEKGGVLYGNYDDHSDIMFHISPDLSKLREYISKDFEKINGLFYKKD